MKKYCYLFLVSILALFSSCDNENWESEELLKSEGQLSLQSLSVDVDAAVKEVCRSINDSSIIDVSNYIINVVNRNTQEIVNTWKYCEMPEIATLNVGEYTIEVKSHILVAAQWDAPFYYGSKDFSIRKNEITEVANVTCTLSNVMVSVRYSEALYNALGEDVKVTISIGCNGTLEYTRDEPRAGYFELPSMSSTIVAEFTGTVNGKATSLRRVFTEIAVGQHHIITFSLNSGSVDPSIIIDANISYEDITIDVPGTEDPEQGERPEENNAPTITSETLDLDGANIITADIIAKVDVNAPLGIRNFVVDIISEQLTKEELQGVGLDSTFDLTDPGDLQLPLTELGFPTGDAVLNQTSMAFDITDFMQLLMFFPGQHQFRLTVTDNEGNTVSKTLTFLAQ